MADEVVLVLGDPLMSSEQLAAPVRELLGERFDILTAEWELPFDAAVEANLAIERGGPTAVPVPGPIGQRAEDVVAVVTQFYPLSAETLEQWPRLRVVSTLRAGIENIDELELERRGVNLVRNLGRNANAVAELTVALMLGCLRDVGESHHSLRTGGWRPEPRPGGYLELAGQRVGLVGLGAVGSLVLRRLSGFEVDGAYFDPYADPSTVAAASLPLEGLLARSDVLSLHARLTPETRSLIGARELDLLPPGAIIVNTARAELIDEAALIDRLRDGRLAGAALDVYGIEPLPNNHPLRAMPNVLLTPHLAGRTVQARTRAPKLLAERLAAALFG